MNGSTSYSDKLRDPRWQKKRLEIFERDGWICIICGSSQKNLHVHHNWYVRGLQPWEYNDSQLCTLCDGCHDKATKVQENLKNHLSRMHPSQQAALLYRSECYTSKDKVFRGVAMSATREDEEPHRIARLRSFLRKMSLANPDALSCLLAVHDHKGCLEATWSCMALQSGFRSAEIVWSALGEYEVKHFLIDENFNEKADHFNDEDHGEVAF